MRKLANSHDALFQVGKGGIAPGIIKQVQEALEARELIKVHVLDNSDLSPREACNIMAEKTGAEGVQVVGNKFVLYKRSKENPKIELP